MNKHNNPVRGRINALLFRVLQSYMDKKYGPEKAKLFADLPETVVELGPGIGTNLQYYKPLTTLIAIEPNIQMHPGLRRSAQQRKIRLDLRSVAGEKIPLPDSSVSAVISSLVLCTVDKPESVLAEVRRILKPGGKFFFIEHVAAEENSFLRALQRWVHGVWHWFFEGCHVDRNTDKILADAGFAEIRIRKYHMKTVFLPIKPHIFGEATR
jgi:ubiquinone/menaquinone biosynthesis C-methylase UbiE